MKFLFSLGFVLFAALAFAQPNYVNYTAFLQKYVGATGKVNYAGIKKDKATLDKLVADFSAQKPVATWSKNEQLAFWINAYNLFTIKLIVDNYPITSITKLDAGKPWDVKRITIGGKKYSLNEIENDIIRPKFNDARIHFAVNCAAQSCPPLLNTAFTPLTLNAQLDERTRNFVRSAANTLTPSSAKISKIFDWYKADFGDVTTFINKYSVAKLNKNATIGYRDYNWDLND